MCPTTQLSTVLTPTPRPHCPPHCVMTTLESWAVGDISPDILDSSMTTAVLNASIETLTALNDVVETTSMREVFNSVIVILTLVRVRLLVPLPLLYPLILIGGDQDKIREDPLVELAKDCANVCHVLKSATEGRDVDNLDGPSKKRIEDLRRCVHPVQTSLLNVTNDIRMVCHIESLVGEWADCAHDSRKHYHESTKECLMVWRAEIREMLRVFDVRDSQFAIVTVSKPPQGDSGRSGAPEVAETNQCVHGVVDAEPPT